VSSDSVPQPTNATESGSSSDHRLLTETHLPFVSVVVPVFNDPEGISATLDALVRQSYPTVRHEVVVVDSASTDRTKTVVQEYSEAFDAVNLVVEDGIQNPYAARNRGIRATSGSVLAFADANMVVGPRWIEGVARTMAASDVEYLACDVELFTLGEEGLIAKYTRLSTLDVERFLEEQLFAPTCCLVVRRRVFEELGTFDTRVGSGSDLEFGNRVHADGRRLEYHPALTMYHPTCSLLSTLLGEALRNGYDKTQLRHHYPDKYGSPLPSALDPSVLLPPRPRLLQRSIRKWETLSTREKIAFGTLTYLRSLATAYGQLRGLIDQPDSTAE
jgi:glycosyltransferase involved in cell wall biosynthesis